MNKPIQEFRHYLFITSSILISLVIIALLASCAITPDFQRRYAHHRETYTISAKRSLIAACISQQLKATTSYKVIESESSVLLMSGETTLQVYDLEDSVGGTVITLYVGSPFYKKEARAVIDACRGKLESQKPHSIP